MTTETKAKRRNIGPCGPLYDLLLAKLPKYHFQHGGNTRIAIYDLAEDLGVSYQHIYQILPRGEGIPPKNKLSVRMARKLVTCSEQQGEIEGFAPLTFEELLPFMAE